MAKETKTTSVKKAVKKAAPKSAVKKAAKAKAKKIVTPKNELLKHGISYIPLVAIVLYFVEKDKSPELMKHIKYGIILFVAYILLSVLLTPLLSGIIAFIYICAVVFLFYKAYTGEAVELDFIDKIEGEVKEKLK